MLLGIMQLTIMLSNILHPNLHVIINYDMFLTSGIQSEFEKN